MCTRYHILIWRNFSPPLLMSFDDKKMLMLFLLQDINKCEDSKELFSIIYN